MSSPKSLSPPPPSLDAKKSTSPLRAMSETPPIKSNSPNMKDGPEKDDMEIDSQNKKYFEEDEDPLNKLQNLEILPELFNLFQDLQSGAMSAKDFDNNAGSIRLKLSNLNQYLQEIEGINESVKVRESRIENLKNSNARKYEFLDKFRQKVESELNST